MWQLSSWYYLRLHYDALVEEADSKACMKMALHQCFSVGNGSDIIHTLPVIHMLRRDWYDDEGVSREETFVTIKIIQEVAAIPYFVCIFKHGHPQKSKI
jgi:hypothetical protein